MVADGAKGSPIAAGLIAFRLGLLASSLIPAGRPEQKGPCTPSRTRPNRRCRKLTEAVEQTAQNLKEPTLQPWARSGRPPPTREDCPRRAVNAAEQVKDQATDSTDTVQTAAR
jgi:hypothetical protein